MKLYEHELDEENSSSGSISFNRVNKNWAFSQPANTWICEVPGEFDLLPETFTSFRDQRAVFMTGANGPPGTQASSSSRAASAVQSDGPPDAACRALSTSSTTARLCCVKAGMTTTVKRRNRRSDRMKKGSIGFHCCDVGRETHHARPTRARYYRNLHWQHATDLSSTSSASGWTDSSS